MKLSSVQRFFRQNKTVKNDWLFQKNWRGYKYLILFNDSRMHILSYNRFSWGIVHAQKTVLGLSCDELQNRRKPDETLRPACLKSQVQAKKLQGSL